MNRDQILAQLEDLNNRVSALEEALNLQGNRKENVQPAEKPYEDKKTTLKELAREASITKKVLKIDEEEGLEAVIGGTWLNRIGVVAFLLGAAFFLKYAFDNHWIGPTGRIIIGFLAGFVLLAIGEFYQNKKYLIFAQGMTGCGIATLYLTVYAARHFYQLIPTEIAFILMVLTTTAAVVLALRYDTLAIAVIGLIGGFATPMLLGFGGKINDIFLFSYIAILTLGILAAAYHRKWTLLNCLSLFFTFLLFAGWGISHYSYNKLWFTQAFLILYFLIFVLVSFLHNIMKRKETVTADIVFILATAALFFGASVSNLTQAYPAYMGFFSVLIAMFYFALGYICVKVNNDDLVLVFTFWGLAIAFATIAIPLQLKANWITIGWAVESVVLLAIGLNQRIRQIRNFSFLVLLIAVLRLLTIDYSSFYLTETTVFIPALNYPALTFLAVIAAISVSAYLYSLYTDIALEEKTHVSILVIGGLLLLLVFFTQEALRYIEYIFINENDFWKQNMTSELTVSIIWMLYSIILITVGIIKKNRPVRLMAIAIFSLTIAKVFLNDIAYLESIYKVISFILLGVILITVSFLYQKYSHIISSFVGPDKEKTEG